MKKLSLLFFAVCASVMSWAADGLLQANPFAYDLRSEVIENGTKLKLTYSLNATAVTSNTYNNTHGIQIYLIDENGNRIKNADGTTWVCTSGSYQKGKDHSVIIPIADLPPAAKETNLSWEAVVHGNKNRTKPKMVDDYYPVAADTPKDSYKPRSGHGIAVDKDPQSKWFGRIFVAEACTNTTGKNSVMEYDMLLNYRTCYNKDILDGASSYFSSATNYEPHRVKISKDGRMFATCYHPTAVSAVVEHLGNGQWKTIVKADQSANKDNDNTLSDYKANDKYNRRPVAIDVRGSGNNLKIIVAWIKPKGRKRNSQWESKIEVYEYNVGERRADIESNKGLNQDDGTLVATYTEANPGGNLGYLFQSFHFGYNSSTHGFIGLAYGSESTYPIWLKVDFAFGKSDEYRPQIVYFTESKKTFDYSNSSDKSSKYVYRMPSDLTYRSDGGYYGGAGLYIKDNQLFTGSGNNTMLRYTIGNDNALTYQESTGMGNPGTSTWLDAFAEDYAGNLYCVSEAGDNIVVVAMPYDGTRITRAPASQSVVLSDPVPNILATDLRYDIVRGKNQYEFSFNVNTKPEEAQIRFYESYDAMKNSLNAVNADNYDGTNNNKPVYVYNIPDDKLKQGRIAVNLGAVGGQVDANGVITNDRLPAGVLYWSVYVKTRKSCVFAPIYQYGATTDATHGHHRKHSAVNNYPETDMFGSLIVAHNPSVTDDATRANRGLHIYGLNPEGNSIDEQGNINNNTRYSKRAEYLNQNADGRLHYPRRLVVGHDGKVYVADEGSPTANRTTQGGVIHEHGGVKVWDPANPNKFALFSDNRIGTATGVALYEHNDGWKLYANNTYNEFSSHGDAYTKEAQDDVSKYGWNGFVGYVLDKYTSGHNGSWSSWGNNATEVALRRGDASGNFAFAAMDKGLWICQYREHTVALKLAIKQPLADNFEAYILSFVPYGTDIRTWKSSESIGVKSYDSNGNPVWDSNRSPYSQYEDSPLQSTPGGGVAYQKINGKEYVYVVNHDGNIAVLEITGWTGTGVSSTPIIPLANIKILTTPEFTKGDRAVDGTATKWHTAFITSMCFDYAGNLVTTTGKGNHDAPQDILVYTMPYDRVNAREIQAPNSCRMIPERIAHLDMDKEGLDELIKEHKIDHPDGCAIDLYRPLQGGMFNTICLPCTLDLKTLPESHPLYEATLREYTGLSLTDIGGEKILELVFTDVANKTIIANKPYIIQLKDDNGYNSIIRFAGPLQLTNTTGFYDTWFESDNTYSITYQGIIPYQRVEPQIDQMTGESLTLMLVADNRLAEMTAAGDMYGFRGYFTLNKPLPRGMQTRITSSKNAPTNTTIVVDGKKVNVEKFLREGRVYIRVGETLYTINGEKVE